MGDNVAVGVLIKAGQELLKRGDEEGAHDRFLEAGQQLYDRHGGKILAQCTWRFGDDGKDVAQEIFKLLWRKMPELEHPETVEAWLYSVRDNKMLQSGRNIGRRRLILAQKQRSIAESVHGAPCQPPEETLLSRGEEQTHQAILQRLPKVLARLDPDEVTLLRMRFHLGLSFANIAVALGVSEATARRRLAKGLKNLNEELRQQRRTS